MYGSLGIGGFVAYQGLRVFAGGYGTLFWLENIFTSSFILAVIGPIVCRIVRIAALGVNRNASAADGDERET